MGAKAKLSITLSEDIVERIDAEVERHPSASRSSVIERWLRTASRSAAAATLREETLQYYESRSDDDRREDEAMARAASRGARRVRYED